MSIAGMYMLNVPEYQEEKIQQALDMLYIDRKNEFRELSQVLLTEKTLKAMPDWKEFVLNFSLDVEEHSRLGLDKIHYCLALLKKALTILRQLGHDKTSMNQLVHLLNMSYSLSRIQRDLPTPEVIFSLFLKP